MNVKSINYLVVTALLAFATQASAGVSAQHVSEAAKQSTAASAYSAAASGKLAAGIVAIPMAVVGAAGAASGEAATHLWDVANRPPGEPLTVTDEVLTVGPTPAEAMAE